MTRNLAKILVLILPIPFVNFIYAIQSTRSVEDNPSVIGFLLAIIILYQFYITALTVLYMISYIWF